MKQKIRTGIIGGAGYTGGELIRLLINHSNAEIIFINSRSNAGKFVHEIHKDLIGETSLQFSDSQVSPFGGDLEGAVLFLCLGHGESKKFLAENKIDVKIKIIDLTNDFRLTGNSKHETRNFVYGLPELNRELIKTAGNIANPGCFATTIQLGLLPLAKAGLLSEIHTTGITGSTGAGQSLTPTSHFSWRANNIQAYKTLAHQHVPEIMESLNQVKPINQSTYQPIDFIPWRGDFTRGIYVSSIVKCSLSLDEATKLYKDYYASHPFTIVSDTMIDMKQVVNTNKCLIHLEKVGGKLVIHSTTDNLLKGACGQAVQNMNLMFGLEETTGLRLKPPGF
jgi:N-acetyl-gamma-glutamyl-phosphate reductase